MIVLIESINMNCKTCEKEKEPNDFYQDNRRPSGRFSECIECQRKRSLEWRKSHIERARENARRWNHEHLELRALRERERRKNNPGNLKKANRKYLETHPERKKRKTAKQEYVHNIFKNGLRSGRIKKPFLCEQCGNAGLIHGHHSDYEKPFNVTWLCARCHALLHKGKY